MGTRQDDLELAEDYGFQVREWRWQSIGRGLVLLVVAAALAGLTGKSPISRSIASSPDGTVTIRYERFLRNHDGAELVVDLKRMSSEPRVTLQISSAFLEDIRIQRIMPEPERELAARGFQQFEFASSTAGDMHIVIHFEPVRFGRLNGLIQGAGRGPVRIQQFVYP